MHYFRPPTSLCAAAKLPSFPTAFRSMRELTPHVLDRLADAELQHGHHARAERLSQLAAEIRAAEVPT